MAKIRIVVVDDHEVVRHGLRLSLELEPDMALIGEMYRPDLAILSIGDFYTMGPFGAAHAVRLVW